jgi:hypothetical protein
MVVTARRFDGSIQCVTTLDTRRGVAMVCRRGNFYPESSPVKQMNELQVDAEPLHVDSVIDSFIELQADRNRTEVVLLRPEAINEQFCFDVNRRVISDNHVQL